MSTVDKLLNKLVKYPDSDIVANPYHKKYAVNNLRQYFEYMFNQDGKRILLVAEAPGYKGCAITGIPLTSGRVFQEISHPLLLNLKDKIYLPRVESENTATIVWSYLATKKLHHYFGIHSLFIPIIKAIYQVIDLLIVQKLNMALKYSGSCVKFINLKL